mgnify:CR=1 FL=1
MYHFSLHSAGQAAVRELYTVDLVQPWWRFGSEGPPVRKDSTGRFMFYSFLANVGGDLFEKRQRSPSLKSNIGGGLVQRDLLSERTQRVSNCFRCNHLKFASIWVPDVSLLLESSLFGRSRMGDLEESGQGGRTHCGSFPNPLTR